MTLDIGYHVMSDEAAAEHSSYLEVMSVMEFLRRLSNQNELPMDLKVEGLDAYLRGADDSQTAARIVHNVLRERVNFVFSQSPVIQFVVDEVEHWDGGVLPINGKSVRLVTIFGGSMEQEGPGWYSGEFNVQS